MVGNRRIICLTSMWTQQSGVFSCLSHFKLQFILDEIIHWIYDPSRINLRCLWSTDFGQLRSWSKSRRRSQDCPRLFGTSLCGERHLCCVIELFESCNPKPTSFLTRCYAWEASVQNQFKLGTTKWNVIWKHYLKELYRIDGEQMEFVWKILQDSLHCKFSMRFKTWWQN